jgi:hypothetical protein
MKLINFMFALALIIAIGIIANSSDAVAYFVAPHVQAAALTAVPVESCEPWRMAGTLIIYKCVDEDPPWATCYAQGVMLFCVME